MHTELPYTDLQEAIREAKRQDRVFGEYRYVMRTAYPTDGFVIVLRAPLLGEWYGADGIRHG